MRIEADCGQCGLRLVLTNPKQRSNYWQNGITFCSRECSARHVAHVRSVAQKGLSKPKTAVPIAARCSECGAACELTTPSGRSNFRTRGQAFCTRLCSNRHRAKAQSARQVGVPRPDIAARMTVNNPMLNPATRAKVSATLRAMKWRPPQGGNGRGPTAPQLALSRALGWRIEVPVRTGRPRPNPEGLPTNYKLDIAEPALKLGIEVDGRSHSSLSRRAEDARQDACLAELGWTVLRFSNQRVTTNLEDCLRIVEATAATLRAVTA